MKMNLISCVKLSHLLIILNLGVLPCTSPVKNLTIDERLVKSCHWSEIRQYIKDKPTRWGIKLWVLADSSNGYTADFNVYIGKAARKETKAFSKSGLNIKHLFAQGVLATGAILKKTGEAFQLR